MHRTERMRAICVTPTGLTAATLPSAGKWLLVSSYRQCSKGHRIVHNHIERTRTWRRQQKPRFIDRWGLEHILITAVSSDARTPKIKFQPRQCKCLSQRQLNADDDKMSCVSANRVHYITTIRMLGVPDRVCVWVPSTHSHGHAEPRVEITSFHTCVRLCCWEHSNKRDVIAKMASNRK